MSLDFSNELQGVEEQKEKDSLGGGGAFDSDVYELAVDVAYTQKSKGGALGFHLVCKDRDGNVFRDTQWITSGDAKGNKPYYEKDGKRFELPGYSHVRSMVEFLTGKQLKDLKPQDAELRLWNGTEEAPTTVTTYPELRGVRMHAGILKIRQNKVKNSKPTSEEQFINEFVKFFTHPGKLTATEQRAGMEQGEFVEKWLEKNKGQVVDKYKEVKDSSAGTGASSGNPLQQKAAAQQTADDDLFGD